MNFEQPEHYDRNIRPSERQDYLMRLQAFIGTVLPTGAVSDETEAVRLYQMLQKNEPIKKSYVEKILGQLGSADDRGSLYH